MLGAMVIVEIGGVVVGCRCSAVDRIRKPAGEALSPAMRTIESEALTAARAAAARICPKVAKPFTIVRLDHPKSRSGS
jgi:hypothetical protein